MLFSGCDEILFCGVSPINVCSLHELQKCLGSGIQNRAAYQP